MIKIIIIGIKYLVYDHFLNFFDNAHPQAMAHQRHP